MKVNFKSYLRTLLAAAAVMFMAPGCDDDGTEGGTTPVDPGKEVPSYTFAINVSSVLDSRVSVLVTPSELGATFYCGVATKELFDIFASDAAFLANDVENLQKEALDREMNFQNFLETVVSVSSTSETVTVPVSGLTKQTEYYAYCYGITLDGVVTSPLAKVAFTSGTPAPVDLVLQSEAKDITTDAVKVAVSALRADGEENAQNGYICEVQLKKTVDDFFADDAALISALEELYAKADPSEGLLGKALHGSQDVAVSGLLSGAEYYMILFGYDSTGVTTEVVKSTFTTKEKSTGGNQGGGDEQRTGYAAWVGDWTITSATSEVNGKPVSFNVTIAEDVYNKSFKITGWGISNLRTEESITIAANYSNGMLSIPNDQLVASIDDGDVYWKGRFYYTGQKKYYLISGNFDALVATLGSDNKSATMVGGDIQLSGDDNTYTVSSVDIFLIASDGIYSYKPADGYTSGDYPVGPYTMKKTADGPVSGNGGGDEPNPGNNSVTGGDANFTIDVTNITATGATIGVTPKNTSAPYFWALMHGSWNGGTDAQIIEYWEDAAVDYGGLANNCITGFDSDVWDDLTTGTEYVVIAFGYDTTGATTSVCRVLFTASNGGGSGSGGGEGSDAYKAWIGTWSVTSTSAAVSQKPVTFDVSIAQKVAGVSYDVTGWSITKLREIPTLANFDSATSKLLVPNNQEITQTSDGTVYYVALCESGGRSTIVTGSYDALSGTIASNGQTATVVGYEGNLSSGSTFKVNTVEFLLKTTDNKWYGYYAADGFTDDDDLIGPFTMTKKSATPAPAYAKAASMSSMLTSAYLGAPKKSTSAAKTLKMSQKDLKNVKFSKQAVRSNPLMQLGSVESIFEGVAVATSSNSASLKIYKTVSDIRVRTARTK